MSASPGEMTCLTTLPRWAFRSHLQSPSHVRLGRTVYLLDGRCRSRTLTLYLHTGSMDENLAHCSYEAGSKYPGNIPTIQHPSGVVILLRAFAPGVLQEHVPLITTYLCVAILTTNTVLEDPDTTPPADMWKLTQDPLKAPDEPEDFTLEFTKGIPSKLHYMESGQKKTVTNAVDLFLAVNAIAKRNGVGRIDIVRSL